MQTYTLNVSNRRVTLASDDSTMVRTSRGIDRLKFVFSDGEWAGFDVSVALSRDGIHEVPVVLAEEEDGTWTCTVDVPDSILEHDGALGVAVHGVSGTDHIITAYAEPLYIEHEGDAV